MDLELLIALWGIWFTIFLGVVVGLSMLLYKSGEAFHPHLTDLERRHNMLEVACGTVCKNDFAVKSISAYIAPRGSSSDKYFTVLMTICSTSGCFGAYRWYAVGDATVNQALLCAIGFIALILIPVFEFDVSTNSFLEEKLSVTNSFIRMLGGDKLLNQRWTQYSPELLDFVKSSKDLHLLFEEAKHADKVEPSMLRPKFILHMAGAGIYCGCVIAAIVLNDYTDSGVAVASGFFMNCFAVTTYLCGTYIPIGSIFSSWEIHLFDGLIFPWNPFYYEKNFLVKLQMALNEYHLRKTSSSTSTPLLVGASPSSSPSKDVLLKKRRTSSNTSESPSKRKSQSDPAVNNDIPPLYPEHIMEKNAQRIISSRKVVAFMKTRPKLYLRVLSFFMVLTELASLLSPIVGIGFQWISALCKTQSTLEALVSITFISIQCAITGDYHICNEMNEHCVNAR